MGALKVTHGSERKASEATMTITYANTTPEERKALRAQYGPARGNWKFALTMHRLENEYAKTGGDAEREAIRLHLLSHPAASNQKYVATVNKTWGAK